MNRQKMNHFQKWCVRLLPAIVLATGCATIDERAYYRDAIEKFANQDKGIPDSGSRCWLTPDLNGGVGNSVLAEEEFVMFLLKNKLCRIVEKHQDDSAGYKWPESDRCPCPANVHNCDGTCPGAASSGGAAPAGGLPLAMPGLGGGAKGDDNNRSKDQLLERYKKSTMPEKIIVYRIDEETADKCTIFFRVSDTSKADGTIETAGTVTVTPKG